MQVPYRKKTPAPCFALVPPLDQLHPQYPWIDQQIFAEPEMMRVPGYFGDSLRRLLPECVSKL